ncbi:helix-turn-helix domain-containing protein [Catenulispora rubra]|uniref:helix-turn-helix domain-containing protein n=1 Tax=Catenulispora rubra TaxID=280293 RepID=UPI0018928335|nr:helix-turn-helix domain-containing protein [Catenulispora rubra]
MARWKPLPEELDPLVVQLVAELRKLKDDSGLSLNQLAKKTGFSASSWERYLGGRAFAPESVVRALATAVGADDTNLLVLHQTAQQAWVASRGLPAVQVEVDSSEDELGSAASSDEADDGVGRAVDDGDVIGGGSFGGRSSAGRRIPSFRTIGALLASALVGSALTVLVIQPWQGTKTVLRPAAKTAPQHYDCRFTQTGGKWYAGNSTTNKAAVTYGMSGPDVAELQCLLQRAGHSPGDIDGTFGPKTLRAVIQEQNAANIDLDGQVGSQTWGKLRG